MTIYLGSTDFSESGDSLLIKAPLGFASVDSCRITNYTVDVLILENITGDQPQQEYLMPFVTNVYKTVNISVIPKMRGLQLGADIQSERVLIEWSTDGLEDFPGTYPMALVVAPQTPDDPSFTGVDGVVVLADSATGNIPEDNSRVQTTFVNQGPGNVFYSYTNTTPDDTNPTLAPGQGIAAPNGSAVYFTADSSGATVGWSGTVES